MEDEMHKILVALLVSVLVTPTGGFAQTPPTNDGRDGTLRIPTRQFPTGIMREAVNRESVRLAGLPPALRQQQPRERSWPGRHPVLFGALVGMGVGLGVQAAVIPGESGGEPHSAYLPIFGGMGAGIGSLVGLIVSVARR
jgi:hypothetical protein